MISDLLGLWRLISLVHLGIAGAVLVSSLFTCTASVRYVCTITDKTKAILIPTIQFIYNVTLHPLARYPGPLLHGGSNIPAALSRIRGLPIKTMHELHEKYGPVVRFAPNEITYISAQAWKDIYGHRKGQEQSESPTYTLL